MSLSREQKILRARELREQGLSYKAIARDLGVGSGTVYRWINPEYAERHNAVALAWKHRNKEYVREYDRTYNETHKGTCAKCGGPTNYQHDGGVCKSCVAEGAREKYRLVERLWNEGKTDREIADALGWGPNSDPGQVIDRARAEGYHLPYRYTTGKRAGRKFPEQVAA